MIQTLLEWKANLSQLIVSDEPITDPALLDMMYSRAEFKQGLAPSPPATPYLSHAPLPQAPSNVSFVPESPECILKCLTFFFISALDLVRSNEKDNIALLTENPILLHDTIDGWISNLLFYSNSSYPTVR